MELLQIRTKNDVNGNSRIVWLCIKDGAVCDGEIQGPEGKPARFRGDMDVVITVSPSEFRAWCQQLAAVLAWNAKVASAAFPCAA